MVKRKLAYGLLLALLVFVGCGDDYKVVDEGCDVIQYGIVNDTMAMLAVRYWENYDTRTGEGWNYLGWGLVTIDPRNEKAYLKQQANDLGEMNGAQLSDSVMMIWNSKYDSDKGHWTQNQVWFWTIGKELSSQRAITWIGDDIDFDRVRPWKDGEILLISKEWTKGVDSVYNYFAILDSSTGIAQKWSEKETVAWVSQCDDVQWRSLGGVCLVADPQTQKILLFLNGNDSLSSLTKERTYWPSVRFFGNHINFADSIYSINSAGILSESMVMTVKQLHACTDCHFLAK